MTGRLGRLRDGGPAAAGVQRMLVTVTVTMTVVGSAGPIRFVASEEEPVREAPGFYCSSLALYCSNPAFCAPHVVAAATMDALGGRVTPPHTHPCATSPYQLGDASWSEAFPPLGPFPSPAALGTPAAPSATAHVSSAPAHGDATAGTFEGPHATSGATASSAGVAAHHAGPSTSLATPGLQDGRYAPPPGTSDSPAAQPSFAQMLLQSMSPPALPLIAHRSAVTDQGEPAAFFTMEEIKISCKPLELAVIARTPQGCPPFQEIRTHLTQRFPFKQDFFLSVLDARHLLIRLQNKEDFLLLLLKESMYIQGRIFYFFKWTMDFSPNKDSPIIPVWIELPALPANFYNTAMICTLARSIGPVLKVDRNTICLTRTQAARINVQMDTSKQLPERIWVGIGADGYWQAITYPDPPKYCNTCKRLGHLVSNYRKGPTARGGDEGRPDANQKSMTEAPISRQPVSKPTWKVVKNVGKASHDAAELTGKEKDATVIAAREVFDEMLSQQQEAIQEVSPPQVDTKNGNSERDIPGTYGMTHGDPTINNISEASQEHPAPPKLNIPSAGCPVLPSPSTAASQESDGIHCMAYQATVAATKLPLVTSAPPSDEDQSQQSAASPRTQCRSSAHEAPQPVTPAYAVPSATTQLPAAPSTPKYKGSTVFAERFSEISGALTNRTTTSSRATVRTTTYASASTFTFSVASTSTTANASNSSETTTSSHRNRVPEPNWLLTFSLFS
ncbi:hypothetical protein Taro_053097 [Colocasia esculenta]|uniref:DUF4283 domain-containing protein n=1 Tax=Colocasia esculenta TaxID=4460 RepID=A0A843XKA5_COLES|nr:hypothetical protein [Colocasia esculenta]